MIALLSPAKTLDFESPWSVKGSTAPRYLKQTKELVERLQLLDEKAFAKLVGVSPKLAQLNVERHKAFVFSPKPKAAKPCLLAFKGDVYKSLEVDQYSQADFDFAQDHIRILSGLYGALRPLDLIQPYRLEMGTALENSAGKDLYALWQAQVTPALDKDVAGQTVVNLASQEYFKAVDAKRLKAPVLTVQFKQDRGGQIKTIALLAKRARGMMANYMVRNRITKTDGLKDFKQDGYKYQPKLSSESEWVFLKKG